MATRAERVVLVALVACSGCATSSAHRSSLGTTQEPRFEAAAASTQESRPKRRPLPEDVVERAAMPHYGVRLSDNEPLPPAEFFDELSRADVICVGEQHDNPHHHYAQLEVARQLATRAAASGRQFAIGFEMFQAPFQRALDNYVYADGDEAKLLEESEWDTRWGYDFALYRPLVALGREHKLPLLALNAAQELSRKVGRKGLAALSKDERNDLPQLDLQNAEHRAAFDRAMQGHPHGHGKPENLYTAQVLWDETMAENAHAYVSPRLPINQLLVIAGSQHCRRSAIPDRVERRGGARAAAVMPLLELPSDTPEYDYAMVLSSDTP